MLVHRVCRAWKEHGPIGLMRNVVRRVIPFHVSLVYRKTERSSVCAVPGLLTERYGVRSAVGPDIINKLQMTRGPELIREFDKLFARGCELWLGWIEGEIAGICWSRGRKNRTDWFVPLQEDDATLVSAFVFPQYRGRGIYPTMMETIVRTLMDHDQVSNVYADCKSWNAPSIRGLQKAGFSLIGNAVRMVLCGRVWIFRNRGKTTE